MKQSAILSNSMETISIMSVSPLREDQDAIQAIILPHSKSRGGNEPKWTVWTRATLEAALTLMQQNRIPVVVCERDLQPGTWKDLLEKTAQLSHPPAMIVTSRLADEHLWAEALNLGAWDVLSKPFDRTEVIRVVEAAWRHWKNEESSAHVRYRMRMTA